MQDRRVVHTSDLHLDDLSERRSLGLGFVVDLAIEEDADALLIAGDFFDNNRVSDSIVEFAIGQLNRFGGTTVIVAGNHDCLCEDSVYHRMELWHAAERTQVLRSPTGQTVTLGHLGLSIWGQSLMSYGGDAEPLADAPPVPVDGENWEIGLGHGYVMEPDGRAWASFHIEKGDIAKSGRDYVALGDSHALRCVSDSPVTAYYSGAPSSGTHTVALIELLAAGRAVRVSARSLRACYRL